MLNIDIGDDGFLLGAEFFNGPVDLLVELVRQKKIDIANVPVLDLISKLLWWLEKVDVKNLEVASDWLVMTSTLAFMKSKILIPSSKDERDKIEDIMEDFVFKLHRMQAIKNISEELAVKRRLGVDWFERGVEASSEESENILDSNLYSLLKIYVDEASVVLAAKQSPFVKPFFVFSIDEALLMLANWIKDKEDWVDLTDFVRIIKEKKNVDDEVFKRSKIASSYVANLELVKRGVVDIKQNGDGIQMKLAGDSARYYGRSVADVG